MVLLIRQSPKLHGFMGFGLEFRKRIRASTKSLVRVAQRRSRGACRAVCKFGD